MMLLKHSRSFSEKYLGRKLVPLLVGPTEVKILGRSFAALKDKLLSLMAAYRVLLPPNRGYADYVDWIRQEPANTVFETYLAIPRLSTLNSSHVKPL